MRTSLVGPHPIVLLEPVVHVAVATVVLGWFAAGDAVMTGFGVALMVASVLFGLPAFRAVWRGLATVRSHAMSVWPGPWSSQPVSIVRGDIASVHTRGGGRRLRYDPVHLLLSMVSDYGSVEIGTGAGERVVLYPVPMTDTREMLVAWQGGARPAPTAATPRWVLPLVGAGVLALCGGAALYAPADAVGRGALLVGAGIGELAFWICLAAMVFRGGRGEDAGLDRVDRE